MSIASLRICQSVYHRKKMIKTYPIKLFKRSQYNMLPLGILLCYPDYSFVGFLLGFRSLSLLRFLDSAVILQVNTERVGGVHQIVAGFDSRLIHLARHGPTCVEDALFLENIFYIKIKVR